jgi:hypothetical protein
VLIDGHGHEGRLILVDGQLAAVIVRLDSKAYALEQVGRWNVEAGFGNCDPLHSSLFETPEEAGAWVERTLTARLAGWDRWEGPIRGLRLPQSTWDALRREGITTLDQLKAVADQVHQFPGIGPKTAQLIRQELACIARPDGSRFPVTE